MKIGVILLLGCCLTACAPKTVLIQGNGSAQADPDVARISAVVTTHEDTVARATQRSNQRVQAVLDDLKSRGLDPKSFGARNFSVRPSCKYDNNAGKQICNGFDAESAIAIELTDLTKVGPLLAGLGDLGADIIDPPDYAVKDETKLRTEARKAAISDAREQAKVYAAASGWRVGKVIGVESTQAVGSQYSQFRYVRQFERAPMNAIVTSAPRARSVPITPDNVSISDSVFVEFELQGSWNPFADKTWW